MANWQYGVRFRDGSVCAPWNGATQLERATEFLAQFRATYQRDAARTELVRRAGPGDPWHIHDHDDCCAEHDHHVIPHRGCILR